MNCLPRKAGGSALRYCVLAMLATSSLVIPAMANEWPAVTTLGSLDGTTGFRLNGADDYDLSGKYVSSAGDVNGDGFDDLIVRASDGYEQGEINVVFGKAGGFSPRFPLSALNGKNGFRLYGADQPYDQYNTYTAASAGDINGDGFDDIVIGAENVDQGLEKGAGETFIVFGKAKGFPALLKLTSLNGSNGFRISGINGGDHSGGAVASAGDINNDGLDDILIGASGAYSARGESYVVFGSTSAFPPQINLSTLDGSNGFRLRGIDAGDSSGGSVAAAGDVNGDDFGDIITGAPAADANGNSASGETYVVFGKALGFPALLNLSGLNGHNGFRIDGAEVVDRSGYSVASAGDLNGDGLDDMLIGSFDTTSDDDDSYLVFGKAGGFAAAIDLKKLNGSNGFRVSCGDDCARAVDSAGDVNGDGFADMLIGSPSVDFSVRPDVGVSYVFFGKASSFPAAISLTGLNGAEGFELDGIHTGDHTGFSVSSIGDFNGDGFADMLIGAPNGGGQYDPGQSFVVFGRAPDGPRTRWGSAASQYISGGAFADKLHGTGGRDILEGRGGGDTIDGGLGKDAASYKHAEAWVIADLAEPANNRGDAKGDSYQSIENIEGSAFGDVLRGDGLENILTGGKGPDTETGGGGSDLFRIEKPADSLPGTERDRIADFKAGTAARFVDRIDVSAIDADTSKNGNQKFTFIGTAPFTLNVKGQLRVKPFGTSAIVEGDVNRDKAADFQIQLLNFSNIAGVTSLDFKL